jgi:hypothetical protein
MLHIPCPLIHSVKITQVESVKFYWTAWHRSQKINSTPHNHCCGNLNSSIWYTYFYYLLTDFLYSRSWDSPVGLVTRLWAGQPRNQDSISGRGKRLFSITSRPALWPTQPPTQWVPGAVSLGLKWQGRVADCSPPYSAEVKNGGAIPLLPHMSTCHSG